MTDTTFKNELLHGQGSSAHMAKQGSGVILTLSTLGARLTGVGFLGNGVASAAIEAFSRILAGELGPSGIRVVCLRPDAIPETVSTSHTAEVFSGLADLAGTTVEGILAERASTGRLLKRLPRPSPKWRTSPLLLPRIAPAR
jgi:3-oxoacyl-[acyl-carrier protein] reductase